MDRYKALALRLHPDKVANEGPAAAAAAAAAFADVTAAHAVLLDTERRREYLEVSAPVIYCYHII